MNERERKKRSGREGTREIVREGKEKKGRGEREGKGEKGTVQCGSTRL